MKPIKRRTILKKQGRPLTGRTESLHASCKPNYKKFIKKLGHGNISLGLEVLVDRYKRRTAKEQKNDSQENQNEVQG